MIEISFWKIMVVLAVALIVLGPQQLPRVARMLGRFITKMQTLVASAQKELKAATSDDDQEPPNKNQSPLP